MKLFTVFTANTLENHTVFQGQCIVSDGKIRTSICLQSAGPVTLWMVNGLYLSSAPLSQVSISPQLRGSTRSSGAISVNTQHSVSRPRTTWHVDCCRGRGRVDDRSTSWATANRLSIKSYMINLKQLNLKQLYILMPCGLQVCIIYIQMFKNIPRIFASMASRSLEIQNLRTCSCISFQSFPSGRPLSPLSVFVHCRRSVSTSHLNRDCPPNQSMSQDPVRTRPSWTGITGEDRETLPASAGGC